MKTTDFKAEIRKMTATELQERIDTEVAAYTTMKLNHTVAPLEDNSQIKAARRNIARMKTVLREMQTK